MNNRRVVIITGASSGIGFFISQRLEKIYNLILISKTESKLKKCNEKLEHDHSFYSIDISDKKQVEKFFHNLKNDIDEVYGLINCAGIFGGIGKISQVNPKDFDKAFNVNFFGSYYMNYFALRFYRSHGLKKIINFSGGGATYPFPRYSSYACSKIALVKLTENLAIEYPNIDCNIIAPGFINTNLAQQTLNAGKDRAGDFYDKTIDMLHEGGQPVTKVAGLIKFLLSKKSQKISGKFISAQWDNWEDIDFQKKLRSEKDLCTLRRIDDLNFTLINERI